MQVIFSLGLDGGRIEAAYDRSKLALGALVHVSSDPEGHPVFSPTPSTGSTPYAVVWIATSEWWVLLANSPSFSEHDANQIVAATKGMLSKEYVDKAISKCRGDISLKKLYITEEEKGARSYQLLAVAQRLELVDLLISAKDEQRLHYEAKLHYGGLIIYLLLTCFDLLGQPAKWMDFGSWLSTKEPDSNTLTATDAITCAKQLHRQWLDKYSVRNSFYRFINEVISNEDRTHLLESLIIKDYKLPPEPMERIQVSDDQKIKYLFDTRNRYTHRALFVPGNIADVPPISSEVGREQARTKRFFRNVSTIGWPDILIETVRKGLVRKIQLISEE